MFDVYERRGHCVAPDMHASGGACAALACVVWHSANLTVDLIKSQPSVTESMPPEDSQLKRRNTTQQGGPGPGDLEACVSRRVYVQDHSAAVLTFKNLKITAVSAKKVLIDQANGTVDKGLWAVMGASGSGKTTLLNALACRLDHNMKVTGDYRLNGKKYDRATLKKMAGYVMQDDLLNGNLTVEETLSYTAQLRLDQSFTDQERQERVDEVIKQMGLRKSRNTVVGTPLKKGISGGERKRLCVAMELLMHPSLLFLDEPTSGLDSVAALGLVASLKELVHNWNCTVVCTIHQPQSKIFNMFENLLLLKSGKILYQGSTSGALEFYERAGYPCPPLTNPADHLLDVIQPALGVDDTAKQDVTARLLDQYSEPEVDLNYGSETPLTMDRQRVPWIVQLAVLIKRTWQENMRRWGHFITLMGQTIVMAVLIGTVFLQIGTGLAGYTRRQPSLFFCVINQGIFGALTMMNSFPSERMLVLRERAAGTYHVSAYYIAKTLVDTIVQLPMPIIFSCIVYWLIGYQANAGKFFIFMSFMILCSNAATSLAMMISAWCRTTELTVIVLPMALEVTRLFGGFFLSPKNLPEYFIWLDALSYVKYTYVGISINELDGLVYACGPEDRCLPTGAAVEKSLGFDSFSIPMCIGILFAFIAVCRIFAYLGIRYVKW